MRASLFWCGNLKTGNLVVGWLSLAIVVLNAVSAGVLYGQMVEKDNDKQVREEWTTYIEFDSKLVIYGSPYICIFYIVAILKTLATVSLLYGTYKEQRYFLIPYLAVFSITIGLEVLVIIYRLSLGVNLAVLFPAYLAIVPIGVYSICVVGIYYLKLR